MRVTSQQLKDCGACADELALFQKYFGESVEITEGVCLSVASEFNWDWAAAALFSARARYDYAAATIVSRDNCATEEGNARRAYDTAMGLAMNLYDKTMANAWIEASRDASLKSYVEAIASARDSYEVARITARNALTTAQTLAAARYDQALASAFAKNAQIGS